MNIKEHSVVSINYKMTGESGELLEESNGQPYSYLHGTGSLIRGLEKKLEGKSAGESLNVVVAPDDAYGPVQPELIQRLPINSFQGVEKLELGMEFEVSGEDEHTMVGRVETVEGNEVTINGNHQLAGMTLTFDVDIIDVREASAEELAHGHPHAESGHHQ